jgi:cytochrome b involved in lipid metabolism
MKARRSKKAKFIFDNSKIGREVVEKLCESKDIQIMVEGKVFNIKQI